MPKNVVLCCDGTANEFARDNTNVVKLFYTLVQNPDQQVAYYHPGIGTMEAAGALTTVTRKLTKLAGQAIGYGLAGDIRDAYVFLMNHFEPGDRVFLFGFSRGAYTARAVASLLRMYGLIRKGNEPLVPYAIRRLMAVHNALRESIRVAGCTIREASDPRVFELAAEFAKTFSYRDCKPRFVGVWDTVSSVGWIANPLKLPYSANNPDIEIGRHAVSIDEHRAFFRSNLWRPAAPPQAGGPKDLKQVWFPGVHCDVGGGYPEKESGLSKIALAWMLREAQAAGLLVDRVRADEVLGNRGGNYAKPDPAADPHESLEGLWRIAEFIPKRHFDHATNETAWRMNLFRRRTIPPKSLIHRSAYQRGADYAKRLPPDGIPVD